MVRDAWCVKYRCEKSSVRSCVGDFARFMVELVYLNTMK